MRRALMIWLGGLLLSSAGCGRGPLVTGKADGGMIWKNPTTSPSNEGHEIAKESRVDVYDRFIVVNNPDGRREVVPDTYFSGLVLKKD